MIIVTMIIVMKNLERTMRSCFRLPVWKVQNWGAKWVLLPTNTAMQLVKHPLFYVYHAC